MAQAHYPRLILALLAGVCLSASAQEFTMQKGLAEDPDAEPWKESSYKLPAFPKDENLIGFDVGAAATAKYFIDHTSIQAGTPDGVVRYAMVIKTSGGATNVSYEGLRCEAAQVRIYATGRSDGTWAESAKADWRSIARTGVYLHQNALSRNYFCPNRIPIFTAKEGLNALRRGMHPDVPGQEAN